MLLDLTRLKGAREHIERTVEPSAFDPQDAEYRVVAPVELALDIQRQGADAYAVSGRVATRLEMACSRCLEPFAVPVDASFELRYVPAAENTGEGELEVEEEDLTTAYYREGMLDLIELMSEQFVLALPMKPLCEEACRGLCPQCGTNRNKAQCDCAVSWEDPRLAQLKSLLDPRKEN
jgi:uncharacterized protein